MLGDLGDRRGLGEAGGRRERPLAVLLLLPPSRGGLAAPAAVGVDDAADVGGGQRVAGAVDDVPVLVEWMRTRHLLVVSMPVSTRSTRVCIVPSLRASMKRVSPLRPPGRLGVPLRMFLPVLSRVRNQRQTGMPVVKKSCAGMATMQSTRSASTILRRISPSPPVLLESSRWP